MMMSLVPPGLYTPKNVALTFPLLKQMITAEWHFFVVVLKKNVKKIVEAKGNNFCQLIHDRCTLGKKSKYQALGLQFVDSMYYFNHVIALTFERVLSFTSQNVAGLAKDVVKSMTGFEFGNICSCSIQDSAAKSVARHLELEAETCDMHDTDKMGRSAIGELL